MPRRRKAVPKPHRTGPRTFSPIPPPPAVPSDHMTAVEAAGYCRVRLATMYERRPGRPAPPRVKVGNRLRYRREDLDRWMAEQRSAAQKAVAS